MTEYTKFGGGDMPVAGLTKVEVTYRETEFDSDIGYAQEFDWIHSDDEWMTDFDIVSYRVLAEAPVFEEWNGGENPAPGKLVEVIFRETPYVYVLESETFDWSHDENDPAVDIVLWRSVDSQTE